MNSWLVEGKRGWNFLGAGSVSTVIFPVVNYECLSRKKKRRLRPLINLFWSGFWLKMPMALIQLSVWQDIWDDLENKTNCLKDSFFVNKVPFLNLHLFSSFKQRRGEELSTCLAFRLPVYWYVIIAVLKTSLLWRPLDLGHHYFALCL